MKIKNLTIVLVHGAFADASGWNDVLGLLQLQGHTVVAPPNPLRGLAADSAYIASVVSQIGGPVLLVGHSYGGAVITNAATTSNNVTGLVYVAGFAPDEGEKLLEVEKDSKDSVLNTALLERKYPIGPGTETAPEFFIKPELFREAFAVDLPEKQAAMMAASQRPISAVAFTDPSGPPAWKKLRSWAIVATGDKTIGTDLVRSMAQRAGADIVELEGSHAIMISKPKEVADVILKAVNVINTQR